MPRQPDSPNRPSAAQLAGIGLAVLTLHASLLSAAVDWVRPAAAAAAATATATATSAIPIDLKAKPRPVTVLANPIALAAPQAPRTPPVPTPKVTSTSTSTPPPNSPPPPLSAATPTRPTPTAARSRHTVTPATADASPNTPLSAVSTSLFAINNLTPLEHLTTPFQPESLAATPASTPPTPSTATSSTASALSSAHPSTHASTTGPVLVPDSRRLQYAVNGQAKGLPYSAKAELMWQHDRASYQARLEISSFLGSRVQTSSGAVQSDGLAPTRFSDKLRTEVAAHFERDKGKVSFSANTPDVALHAGAQDRLSVLLQLGSLLAGAPKRFVPGTAISIQTIGPRDAEDWHFTVGAEESLTLPDATAPLLARKLKRDVRREFEVGVELWLAPSLAYLPVQLRLTQANGDVVQLQLKSAQPP